MGFLARPGPIADGTIDASDRLAIGGLYAGIAAAAEADPCLLYTGPLALPMCLLRNLLASTSEFQTWVGAASTSEARDSIYLAGADSVTRPFALVAMGGSFEIGQIAGGARNWFRETGSLKVMFENAVAPGDADGHAAAEQTFLNDLSGIWNAALALAGSGTHLSIENLRLLEGPYRSDEDEQDDYYNAWFEVRWRAG